jgi:hypothetical protein
MTLTARLDGQGITAGTEYTIDNLVIDDDGFFISSTARVIAPNGDTFDIRNAHLTFDLGIS